MFSKIASFTAATLVIAAIAAPAHAGIKKNGVEDNGHSYQGTSRNGVAGNSRSWQGVSENGRGWQGRTWQGLKINGLKPNGADAAANGFAIDGIVLPAPTPRSAPALALPTAKLRSMI
jgi:hypothetical protein